jgi:hypothetical protein
MVIRRVRPLSAAKVAGMLYALMGLIIGAFISLFSLVGGAMMPKDAPGGFGILFGAAAIIVLPICYGIMGFIAAAISAALYNLVAGWVGGIELDVQ